MDPPNDDEVFSLGSPEPVAFEPLEVRWRDVGHVRFFRNAPTQPTHIADPSDGDTPE